MKVEILLSIILLFITSISFAWASDHQIPWDENYKLQWSDFQGEPGKFPEKFERPSERSVAFTWGPAKIVKIEPVQIKSQYCQFGMSSLDLKGHFNKNDSWVKEDHESMLRLEHEQGHFDIIETVARKVEKYYLNEIHPCPNGIYDEKNIREEVKEYRNKITVDTQLIHFEYDDKVHDERGDLIESKQKLLNYDIDWMLRLNYVSIFNEKNMDSPLKQIRDGITPEDIFCKRGYKRVVSNDSEKAICVTPILAEKLEERNWGQIVGFLRIDS